MFLKLKAEATFLTLLPRLWKLHGIMAVQYKGLMFTCMLCVCNGVFRPKVPRAFFEVFLLLRLTEESS